MASHDIHLKTAPLRAPSSFQITWLQITALLTSTVTPNRLKVQKNMPADHDVCECGLTALSSRMGRPNSTSALSRSAKSTMPLHLSTTSRMMWLALWLHQSVHQVINTRLVAIGHNFNSIHSGKLLSSPQHSLTHRSVLLSAHLFSYISIKPSQIANPTHHSHPHQLNLERPIPLQQSSRSPPQLPATRRHHGHERAHGNSRHGQEQS